MKKVIVIGCPGSGKSTFSRALQEKTGLPVVYMDMLFWNADKTSVSRDELIRRVRNAAAEDSWIIDGNYGGSLELRLEACDTVFFLDYDLETCLSGIASRMGKERPDLPWIETEPDEEFLDYVREFPVKQLASIREQLERCSDRDIHVFHSRREAEDYLNGLVTQSKPDNREESGGISDEKE